MRKNSEKDWNDWHEGAINETRPEGATNAREPLDIDDLARGDRPMPIEANISPRGDSAITTKLSKLKGYVAQGDMRAAILLAAKFQQLGNARNAILSAREAYLRPDFQKQLGRDPQALIEAGVAALRGRYNV